MNAKLSGQTAIPKEEQFLGPKKVDVPAPEPKTRPGPDPYREPIE